MVKNVEALAPGDTRIMDGRTWEVEAAELQEGMMQVLWRSGDERRWDEHAPGSPIIVDRVADPGIERIRMIKNAGALAPADRRIGHDVPGYGVVGVERVGGTVVVEWSNGIATRVREYDPFDGVLVDTIVETHSS